jgi:hypothetical protein
MAGWLVIMMNYNGFGRSHSKTVAISLHLPEENEENHNKTQPR